MSNLGQQNRYPDFPRLPIYLKDESLLSKSWGELARWSSSFLRVLEQSDSQKVFNVTVDKNKSITIAGRIKIGDTNSTIVAQAGDMRFNTTTNKHQGYDGTTWNNFY